MTKRKEKLIIVAGPTASGKSDLAIALARRFGGEIISADSRQVYRGMDIGTGKVTEAEQRLARHWLLDIASPRSQYTAAQWRHAAERVIDDIISRGKVPIICGGTGFYIDSAIYGTVFPEVKPDAKLRARLEKKTTRQLFAQLTRRDPRRARSIDQHNRRRLIRALEIILKTGKPVPRQKRDSAYDVLYLSVDMPFEKLKERIAKRLDARLKNGMVAEVRHLHESGVSWKKLENFGLEYRWLSLFLRKKLSRQEMRDGLFQDIVAYARRQMTWWRKNKDIRWVKNQNEANRLVGAFLKNG